jgi:hypothetical protein
MPLTAAEILSIEDAGLLKVDVPEWKKPSESEVPSVYVRVMSVGERDSYERKWIGKKDQGIENFRSEYLVRVLCDEKGELLFTRDQVAALAKKNGAVLGRLFDVAMKHNQMSEEDVVELGKG